MKVISDQVLKSLRAQFKPGSRVELVKMNDPFNQRLTTGCLGTVTSVDDLGTIHVNWDCGSSLGVAYGEDICVIINDDHE